MKSELERLLREALRSLVPAVLSEAVDPAQVVVERARDAQHGDFQSNIAMRIAKAARKNPRELAQALIAALPKNALVASAEVAGAGFINFRLAKDAWFAALKNVAAQGAAYGRSNVGAGRKVMVEFVSANPTGPMHVGHGRGAAYGATLGNLLEATGHTRLSRVLHQRRRPADRHPRGQRLPAIPRALRRERNVPVERLPRRLHAARGARAARETRRCAAGAPRPTSRAVRRPMPLPATRTSTSTGSSRIRAVCSAPRNSIPS